MGETRARLGDEEFRSYFVRHTPDLLERYERVVAPAAALVDADAMARMGQRWELAPAPPYAGPAAVVAGRLDSTVGYATAVDLAEELPRATLAVLADTGHALPHEQPALLRALLTEWVARVDRAT